MKLFNIDEISDTQLYVLKVGLIYFLVWSFLISSSLCYFIHLFHEQINGFAQIQATEIAERDISYRNYLSKNKDIYVPIDENDDVYDNIKKEMIGTSLGKMKKLSPALIQQLTNESQSKFQTSSKFINDDNRLDEWESDKVRSVFEGRVNVIAERISGDEFDIMRMVKSFQQIEYDNGREKDLSIGVISVSVPMKAIVELGIPSYYGGIFGHILLWFSGVMFIIYSTARIRKRIIDKEVVEGELLDLNQTLDLKVLEKTKILRYQAKQLIEAKEVAEEASRVKSEFLANISHEVRTPLNGIVGVVKMLRNEKLKSNHKELIRIISESSDNLLEILNDLLDLSKIEAGKMELKIDSFDLYGLVFDIAKVFSPLAAASKEIEVIVDVDHTLPKSLLGDPTRIRQIITNLLSNAVKFTDKGEILISIECLSRNKKEVSLKFSVKDTGICIPYEKQAEIFNAFEQVDGSVTRRFGGTGLGLSIAQKLVTLMNGKLTLISTPNIGSTFSFDLSLPINNHESSLEIEARFHNKNILFVDDNHNILKLYKKILSLYSLNVTCYDNVPDAIKELKRFETSFDMIIVDQKMGDMDGIYLIDMVQNHELLNKIPIILTVSSLISTRRDVDVTYNSVLIKPVDPRVLIKVIGEIFSKIVNDSDKKVDDIEEDFKLNLLVVDDMKTNQIVAEKILNSMGHEVSIVSSGKETLELIENEIYDVILMDIQMPELDGVETTRRIREKFGREYRIIAMTANAYEEDIEMYLASGFNACVTKPLLSKNLSEALAKVMSNVSVDCASDYIEGTIKKEFKTIVLDVNLINSIMERDQFEIARVMDKYLKEAPVRLNEALIALENDNRESFISTIHALRGISSHYNSGNLFKNLTVLEDLGRKNQLKNNRSSVEDLLISVKADMDILFDEICTYRRRIL